MAKNAFQRAMEEAVMRQHQAGIQQMYSNHGLLDGRGLDSQELLWQGYQRQREYEYRVRAYSLISNHPGYLMRMRVVGDEPRDTIPAPPPTAPECRECSRPERPIAATHGELCVYCEHKRDDGIFTDGVTEQRNADARVRMAAADRKAQPRPTAESRMLALPHPWECSGEDEP